MPVNHPVSLPILSAYLHPAFLPTLPVYVKKKEKGIGSMKDRKRRRRDGWIGWFYKEKGRRMSRDP